MVPVATQVGVQEVLEDLECLLQVGACLHQEWNIDHQVHLALMVLMVAPMVVHMVVLMVVLMVAHMVVLMAHTVLMAHMVLQVHTDPLVALMVAHMDHMVDPMVDPMVHPMAHPMVHMVPQDRTGLQVWVLIMDLTQVLHVDLHLTTCKAQDPALHPHLVTSRGPCILEAQVVHHQAMVHPLVGHHLTWALHLASMVPHHLVDLLLRWIQGLPHQDQILYKVLLHMVPPHHMGLLPMAVDHQLLMSTRPSFHLTMLLLLLQLRLLHTTPHHHQLTSMGSVGVIIA